MENAGPGGHKWRQWSRTVTGSLGVSTRNWPRDGRTWQEPGAGAFSAYPKLQTPGLWSAQPQPQSYCQVPPTGSMGRISMFICLEEKALDGG